MNECPTFCRQMGLRTSIPYTSAASVPGTWTSATAVRTARASSPGNTRWTGIYATSAGGIRATPVLIAHIAESGRPTSGVTCARSTRTATSTSWCAPPMPRSAGVDRGFGGRSDFVKMLILGAVRSVECCGCWYLLLCQKQRMAVIFFTFSFKSLSKERLGFRVALQMVSWCSFCMYSCVLCPDDIPWESFYTRRFASILGQWRLLEVTVVSGGLKCILLEWKMPLTSCINLRLKEWVASARVSNNK